MYLIECANAYLAAVQLQQKEMDYQTAFAVMMVKKQLQSHVEFLQNEELKLAEKYAEKDEKGNIKWTERGTFYRDADAAAGYQRERRALGMTQVEDDSRCSTRGAGEDHAHAAGSAGEVHCVRR